MFKINKKVEYALIVLKHFQKSTDDEFVTARMISDQYKLPFHTTSKVMQTMNNHKILESTQGVNGGYKVSANLYQVSFMSLAEIIEGKSLKQNCSEKGCSLIESCNITGPVQKLNDYLYSFFKELSLQELLEDNHINQNLIKNLNTISGTL